MAKCGECDNFSKCTHRNATDNTGGCTMLYPDVYMEVNHSKEWKEYVGTLYDKE